MPKIRTLTPLALLLAMALAAPALADPPTIVGSWESSAKIDGVTDDDFLLETYSRDGTLVASGPQSGSSIAHGAWERRGPRTFATTFVILLYNGDGSLAARLRGSTEVEVSLGGETYSGVLSSTLTAADGTVLGNFTGTIDGTRITVD